MVAAILSTPGASVAAPVQAVPGQEAAAPALLPSEFTDGTYIVNFKAAPAARYTGGESEYTRTQPAPGTKLDPDSTAVQRYQDHLERSQNEALAKVGAHAFYSYTTVLNGVAVDLTAAQARQLAKSPEVRSMARDELKHIQTNESPRFLKLPQSLWKAAGGQKKAGSGIVVGVLDTGIWPESRSFAPNGTPIPDDWAGECVTGEEFTEDDCNGKIIGARYYVEGFGVDELVDEEYLSPRDGDGHGSHTASTAAGDRVPDVTVDGTRFGTVSGMAPAAKIAAYKICWSGKTGDGCATSDSVQAIEDAVNDGVDVINYSIGSTSESSVLDDVELSFLNAAAAGVFVAASAGNSGPGPSTLDHPSPWVTTVAASTFKINEKALELADGRRFVGASTTAPLPELTPMVLAAESAAPGVTPDDSKLCLPGSLDPADVAGKLVVCERGTNARIEKSFVVREAGGVGMVLINPTPNSLNGDLHLVPSIHLGDEAYEPVTTYVAEDPDPRGMIVALRPGESTTRVPEVAEFSSRGPSTTTGGDILKPDISAPGVDVLAAVAPPFHYGRDYDLISGTSMSSPHIAGLAAVMIQLYPKWSPMAIKSALMTTAMDNVSTDNPFAQGAGFVRPSQAINPGIVFDHGVLQWLGYLEGVVQEDVFPGINPLDGSQINQASIAIGALAGTETITRTVTNVSGKKTHYRVWSKLPGVDVKVSQHRFMLRKGESKTISITFTRDDAAFDEYTTGHLGFVGGGHDVRIPLAVRPVAAALSPAEIEGTGASGAADVTVTSGFTGTMTTSVAGLLGITPEADSVTGNAGSFDPAAPSDPDDSVDSRQVTVPAGTTLLRMATDGADDADLDLWLYRVVDGVQQLVAVSGTSSADEEVTLTDPAPGEYIAYVHGFSVVTTGDYLWSQWLVGDEAEGNLSVSPESQQVTVGEDSTFTVSWQGLDPAQRYLGWVGFYDGETQAGRVIVSVN